MTVEREGIAAIVVARMTSKRLPGKSLMSLTDRTLLDHVVGRVARSRGADTLHVATSTDSADDPIVAWCREAGVNYFRGPLNNVALRIHQAAEKAGVGGIVRISADSPFIDPVLIDYAIKVYRRNSLDLVTNVFPRTFPKGQSVEVIAVDALGSILAQGLTPEQEEHVTRRFYERSHLFRIANFRATDFADPGSGDLSRVKLSVDSREDLVAAAGIADLLGTRLDAASWQEIAQACWQFTGVRES